MGRAHRLGNIITILGCKFFFAPKDIKIFLTEKNDFFKTERHVDTNFLVNVSVTKRRARCLESSNKSSGQRCAYMTPRIGKFSNFRAKFRCLVNRSLMEHSVGFGRWINTARRWCGWLISIMMIAITFVSPMPTMYVLFVDDNRPVRYLGVGRVALVSNA